MKLTQSSPPLLVVSYHLISPKPVASYDVGCLIHSDILGIRHISLVEYYSRELPLSGTLKSFPYSYVAN